MSDNIMGIEVGNSNIKMIEVSKKGAMMLVHRYSIIPTPEDSVNNGVIVNSEKVRMAIAKELTNKKYKAKKVVNVIQSSSIITRNVTMEKQPDKVIKQILDMKLEEYMPVQKSEYQVDYKILKEVEEEGKLKNEMVLVAAPNNTVGPLAALMKSLKLTPVLINTTSEAIGNVFTGKKRLVFDSDDSILVLDIGGKSSNVTVVADGTNILSRYIDFGVENINKEIENAHQRRSMLDKELGDDEIFEMIRPEIEYNIISEVERLLQFYYSNYNASNLKKVYLIGGGASIKGLRAYIRDTLNIKTEKLNEFNTVSEAPNIDFEPCRRFFVNILGAISGL